MNAKETVAQRLDRAADRFEAAGDPQGALDARAAAAMCRQCETLEEAEGIEESYWASHQEPKRRLRDHDRDRDVSDSDDGGIDDSDDSESDNS